MSVPTASYYTSLAAHLCGKIRLPALLQDGIYDAVDFLLSLIGVNMKAAVARKHGGEPCASLTVEDMYRNPVGFGKAKLVADTQGWCRAFSNHDISAPKPGGILFVNGHIAILLSFKLTL